MQSDVFQVRLKSLRIAKSMTLQRLGEQIGMSRGSLSAVENGRRPISLDSLIAIADALETSVDYLVGRTDDPTRPPPPQPKSD